MRKVKGCVNTECQMFRKKYFKKRDRICPCCGEELLFVCRARGCFKPLPPYERSAYCAVHAAEIKDRRVKFWKVFFVVGGGLTAGLSAVFTILGFIFGFGKKK